MIADPRTRWNLTIYQNLENDILCHGKYEILRILNSKPIDFLHLKSCCSNQNMKWVKFVELGAFVQIKRYSLQPYCRNLPKLVLSLARLEERSIIRSSGQTCY